jgi:LPXTG-motif cell wall-anchored protein
MRKQWTTLLAAFLFIACMFPSAAGAENSLTTEYSANSHAKGQMFNVQNIGGQDLTISSFDINVTSDTGPINIEVYYRQGGYLGYESNASAWTLAGSAVVTAQGKNNVTHLPVGGIRLVAGETYGIYIYTPDAGTDNYVRYTYLDTARVLQNAYLKISEGTGISGGRFVGMLNYPRLWNGTIYYTDKIAPTATETTVPTVSAVPNTGDNAPTIIGLWALMASLSFAAILLLRKRRLG